MPAVVSSTGASGASSGAALNSIHGANNQAYSATVARSGNINDHRQDVTSGAGSPGSAPGGNENSNAATREKTFDFKYNNVYTTPPMSSGGRMTNGRATIGSGSGAGSSVGSCLLM